MGKRQQGQGLVEYALILLLVAIIVVIAVSLFGETTGMKIGEVSSALGGDAFDGTYCDSDMSSSEDWQYEGKGKDLWKIVGDQMCRTTNYQTGFAYSQCSQTEQMQNQSDYTIHLEGVVLNKGQGYGVMFRVQNYDGSPNGYAFQYDPGLEGIVFRKWVNGWEIWQPLAYQKLTNYQWYGVSKDIDVVVKGNSMQAYIDGELVLSAKDDTYSSGGVGLRTWGVTEVCFDNFSINETN
jgi:Flp pilus assembly pilin Flp